MTDLLARRSYSFAALSEAKPSLNKLLAVLDEQLPNGLVAHGRDLDEFSKAVADLWVVISDTEEWLDVATHLSDWEGFEEGEVEEGVQRSMICPKSSWISILPQLSPVPHPPVLELSVVDAHFDANAGVNKTDESRRDADEIACPAI